MKKILIVTTLIICFIVSSVVLVACAEDYYTVTFKSTESEISIDRQVVKKGGYAVKPVDPVSEDYVFVDWVVDESGEKYDFSKEVEGNITLRAVWVLNTDNSEVGTLDELKLNIAAGIKRINITDDILVDSTIYITEETTLLAFKDVTLSRSPEFKGDMFMIGENSEGVNSVLLSKKAILKLNERASKYKLTIDGNKANCADVKGTALFMAASSALNIYDNTIIQNHKKSGSIINNDNQHMDYPNKIGGAAIINNAAYLKIFGGEIINNEVNTEKDAEGEETCGQGGAIWNGGSMRVSGGVISGNKSYKGGAVYNTRWITLDLGSFNGNEATYGGAFYSSDSVYSSIIISGAELSENNAISSGGAIYQGVNCGVLVNENTIIKNNSAVNNGGAICSYGSIVVNGGAFESNFAGSKGGAIYQRHNLDGGVATVRHLIVGGGNFICNVANTGGGAISLDDSGQAIIGGGIFDGNKVKDAESASVGGGAFYVTNNAELNINAATIKNNIAEQNGGAIYIKTGGVVTINGGSISGNIAEKKGGGGIYLKDENSKAIINSVTFSGNTAKTNGGGIYAYTNAALNISGGDFKNNIAAANGGGMYINGVVSAVVGNANGGVNINGNVSSLGGGIYVTKALLSINSASIKDNAAEEDGGGIFAISSGCAVNLKGGEVSGNKAVNGGGISLSSNAKLTAIETSIYGNSVSKGGGGLYTASSGAKLNLDRVIFKNNTSVSNGGAMYLYTGAIGMIKNTSFDGNKASGKSYGGALYANGADINIENTAFRNNDTKGKYGGGVYATTNATIILTDTTFERNTSTSNGKHVYAGGTEGKGSTVTFKVALNSDFGIENKEYFQHNENGIIINDLREAAL